MQILSYASGVSRQMMTPIIWQREMLWQKGFRNHFNSACPTGDLSDALNPFKLCKRLFVPDVVDAAGSSLIRAGKRDGLSDIFDIATCPSPLCSAFLQQDDGTCVIHAFEKFEQPMLWIARAVHLRQSQHRAGQP